MGKITFLVEGSTVGTVAEGRGVRVEYEVSEVDSARLVAAMADFHWDLLKDVQPLTIELIVRTWFDNCIWRARQYAEEYERRKAQLPPINISGFTAPYPDAP